MSISKPPELKKYRLLDLIGCGGMGSVYIGYQLNQEKLVAIKILDPKTATQPTMLKQFKQEGRIIKRLEHPNIVSFVDQGKEAGFYYLVMEYVKGLSLDSFPLGHSMTKLGVKQTLPSMEEYLTVFIGCMDALSYVHNHGLVHCDIKPQNIILRGNEYSPCLIDFGIARADSLDDLRVKPETMFTVAYASPEQLSNKPVEQSADLFSYGVVMYEKLTGYLPFKGKKPMDVFLEQTKWNFPPPRQLNSSVPQKLEQIVLKLLEKNPENRYESADIVKSELEKLLDITKQARLGLSISGISTEIKGALTTKKSFKRRTLDDERTSLRKARTDLVEVKQKIRVEECKKSPNQGKLQSLNKLSEALKENYHKLEYQLKMCLGFRSHPIVVDKFNSIFKLETFAFEKRGVPFNINLIEQRLATTEGKDIIVGGLNFTKKAKRSFKISNKDTYLAWDSSSWFFTAYEEKDFPIFIMLAGPDMPKAPSGFKGFFWPFEFLVAVKKLGWTGVSIIESFSGVDRSGQAIFAEHKETILFSQNLFEQMQEISKNKN